MNKLLVRPARYAAYWQYFGWVDFGVTSITATWTGTLAGGHSVPGYSGVGWADPSDHTRQWDRNWKTTRAFTLYLPGGVSGHGCTGIGNKVTATYLGCELVDANGDPLTESGVCNISGIYSTFTSQIGTVAFDCGNAIDAGWDGYANGIKLNIGMGQNVYSTDAWVTVQIPQPCRMFWPGGY